MDVGRCFMCVDYGIRMTVECEGFMGVGYEE